MFTFITSFGRAAVKDAGSLARILLGRYCLLSTFRAKAKGHHGIERRPARFRRFTQAGAGSGRSRGSHNGRAPGKKGQADDAGPCWAP